MLHLNTCIDITLALMVLMYDIGAKIKLRHCPILRYASHVRKYFFVNVTDFDLIYHIQFNKPTECLKKNCKKNFFVKKVKEFL